MQYFEALNTISNLENALITKLENEFSKWNSINPLQYVFLSIINWATAWIGSIRLLRDRIAPATGGTWHSTPRILTLSLSWLLLFPWIDLALQQRHLRLRSKNLFLLLLNYLVQMNLLLLEPTAFNMHGVLSLHNFRFSRRVPILFIVAVSDQILWIVDHIFRRRSPDRWMNPNLPGFHKGGLIKMKCTMRAKLGKLTRYGDIYLIYWYLEGLNILLSE